MQSSPLVQPSRKLLGSMSGTELAAVPTGEVVQVVPSQPGTTEKRSKLSAAPGQKMPRPHLTRRRIPGWSARREHPPTL